MALKVYVIITIVHNLLINAFLIKYSKEFKGVEYTKLLAGNLLD